MAQTAHSLFGMFRAWYSRKMSFLKLPVTWGFPMVSTTCSNLLAKVASSGRALAPAGVTEISTVVMGCGMQDLVSGLGLIDS